MMTLEQACFNRDYEYLVEWIKERHDIVLSVEEAEAVLRLFDGLGLERHNPNHPVWTSGTWAIWIKLRLREASLILAEVGSPFQLMAESEVGGAAREARSKIFTTAQIPRPINTTAWRVAGIFSPE